MQNQHYGVVAAVMGLTFASVLIESSNPASVVYERSVIEEEGGRTVGESPVVQMVQPAVVLGACTVHTKVKSDVKHDNCLVTVGRPEEEI